MNRNLFRLVFSKKRGMLVAVAENAAVQGKAASSETAFAIHPCTVALRPAANVLTAGVVGVLMVAAACAQPGQALAQNLPAGGVVQAGQATIGLSSGNSLVVQQQSSRAIIDWQNFSIGSGNKVQFVQPGTSSVVLNRVVGNQQSSLLGQLTANGGVFLTNPNGILFGGGAQVDVGHLVATTLGITNNNFIVGNIALSGSSAASIVNQGNIRSGASVALVAAQIVNAGSISSPGGTTVLAAGQGVDLDFNGDKLLAVRVNLGSEGGRIDHSGLISADESGRVIMTAAAKDALLNTAINVTGRISARGVTSKGGEVYLDSGAGGGTEMHGGSIDVTSTPGTGGKVSILGRFVGLLGDALVSADGAGGGGSVVIGGNYQGKGPQRNSEIVYVDAKAKISASASNSGQGGEVVLWSDGTTLFNGSVAAVGGLLGGDGGNVEVSGLQHLRFRGSVDLTSMHGSRGALLLDPATILIGAVGSDIEGNGGTFDLGGNGAGNPTYANILAANFAGLASVITADKVEAQLNSANVTLAANTSITVGSNIDASANANSFGLTLAAPIINLNADIKTRNGAITLTTTTGTTFTGARILDAGSGAILTGAITGATNNLTLTGAATIGSTTGVAALVANNGLTTTGNISAASVSVSGVATLGGNVTTTGTQSYGNTVLDAAVGLSGTTIATGAIAKAGAGVDRNLTLTGAATIGTTTGVATLLANNGLTTTGNVAAASVSVSGVATLGGNVTTTGTQSYGNTVLDAAVGLSGTTIATGAIAKAGAGVDRNLTLTGAATIGTTTGVATLLANNGLTTTGNVAAASVSVSGVATLGGDVTTSTGQSYTGPVVISATRALTSTSNGDINVGGGVTMNANTLTIATGGLTTLNGTLTGAGSVTTDSPGSFKGGSTLIPGATHVTVGEATLCGNLGTGINASALSAGVGTVTLCGDTTLSYGTANTTIATLAGAGFDLTMLGTGIHTIGSTVNDVRDLSSTNLITNGAVGAASVSVSGAATLGGNVTTTGTQSYGNTVLDAAVGLSGTTIATGAITKAGAGADRNLTLTGAATIGTTTGVATLLANNGLTTTGNVAAASVSVSGVATLGGDVTTSTGQSYTGPVVISATRALTSTSNGDINVGGGVTMNANTLTIATGGLTTLNGTLTGAGSVTTDSPGSFKGGSTLIPGATHVTVGEATLCGNLGTGINASALSAGVGTVTLCGDTTLSYGTANTTIATLAGAGFDLTMLGTGIHTIGSTVNDVRDLSSTNLITNGAVGAASVSVSGAATLGGNVTTTGTQSYGNTVLDAAVGLSGTTIATGAITKAGAGADRNLTLTGAATIGTTTGVATLLANNGLTTTGNVAAASVSVSGVATLGGDVTTTAGQYYGGTLLGALALALSGNTISTGTISGVGNSLALTGEATVATIGGVTDLLVNGRLTTTGPINARSVVVQGDATLGGNVTTSATQRYSSTTLNATQVALSGTSLSTGAVTGSGNSLALTGAATVAAIDGVTDLIVNGGLTSTGPINARSVVVQGDATLGGDVTTSATQRYFSTTLNAPQVALSGTTISTGAVTGYGNSLALSGAATTAAIDGVTDLVVSAGLTTTGSVNAGSVAVTGAAVLGGNVTSALGQRYGSTALATNAILTDTSNTALVLGTVDGNGNDVQLVTTGGVNAGAVSGVKNLTTNGPLGANSVAVTGNAALGASVFTSGTQNYQGAVTLANGITISGDGISFAGPVTANSVFLDALSGNLTATHAGNDFQGVVSASGMALTLTDKNALALGNIRAGGNLTLLAGGGLAFNGDTSVGGGLSANTSAAGNITQLGRIVVAGNTNLTAVGKDVSLTDLANDFSALELTAGNVAIADRSGIALGGTLSGNLTSVAGSIGFGATNIGGNLELHASGAVSQLAALHVIGNTRLTTSGAGSIDLSDTGNVFGGPIGMSLGSNTSVTARLTSSKNIDLGKSDFGTAAVTLTALGNDGTGLVIKGGMKADANSTSPSTHASFTQSGVLTNASGGSLLLASPTSSSGADILLNSHTNDLKGTIATTAQEANPVNNFQIKSSQVNIGAGGVTARSVVLLAGSVTTPLRVDGGIRLIKLRGLSSADTPVLTLMGLNGAAGEFGAVAGAINQIYVDTNDYVAVLPNIGSSLRSPVRLEGPRDYKPAYEFASDVAYRFVLYNGETADSPQIRGALTAAIGPLRDTIKEQLSAGFSKENLRKQLTEGVVLQTGVARPGIDLIQNAREVESCEVNAASLNCAAK